MVDLSLPNGTTLSSEKEIIAEFANANQGTCDLSLKSVLATIPRPISLGRYKSDIDVSNGCAVFVPREVPR